MGRALLLIVTGFALTFGSIRQNMQKASERNADAVINSFEKQLLRNTAISAVNMAVTNLSQDYLWRAGYDSVELDGGNFSVLIEDNDDDSSLNKDEVRITAFANMGTMGDTMIARIRKPPFSIYALFTDNIPVPVYFITGDTIRGPMHTNAMYYFAGSPVFTGKVTSVAATYYKWNEATDPQFLGGSAFGVDEIHLPADLQEIYNAAAAGGAIYSDHVEIIFYNDGTYFYQTYYWNGSVKQYIDSGTENLSNYNGVIVTENDKDIEVQGTINGRVTIASAGNIYVINDLLYNTDPRIDANSTDVAGLIAQKNVVVDYNAANANNCEIHASVMALNKSFTVESYNQYAPRGTLTVLGGIIQDERGAVGTFNYSGLATGYYKDYIYDDRFFTQSPPFFPNVEKPQLSSWYE